MAHLRAYQNYLEKLVKCLPMDDTHFITKLSAQELLPGDIESKIKTSPTPADKASYFLSHVIKPALDIDEASDFDELLSIMQNCGYKHVRKLAITIKDEIYKKLMPQTDGIEAKPANIKSEISLQSGKITMQCGKILLQTGEVPLKSDETLQNSQISLQSSEISVQCSELSLQSDEVKGKACLELCSAVLNFVCMN